MAVKVLRTISTPILAILAAITLLGSIGATTLLLQQQASAFVINWKDFKKLTHEFEKNVINGQWDPGDTPPIRELLRTYHQDVMRIFLGGPDTIPALLQSYERDVSSLFDTQPPEPDKQLVKDFRGLTHDFEKAVLEALTFTGPEQRKVHKKQ